MMLTTLQILVLTGVNEELSEEGRPGCRGTYLHGINITKTKRENNIQRWI